MDERASISPGDSPQATIEKLSGRKGPGGNQDPDISKRWAQALRESTRMATQNYYCFFCHDRRVLFNLKDALEHVREEHPGEIDDEAGGSKRIEELFLAQNKSNPTQNPRSKGRLTKDSENADVTLRRPHDLDGAILLEDTHVNKKAAVGSDASPASSVRTDVSASRVVASRVRPKGSSRGGGKLYEPSHSPTARPRNSNTLQHKQKVFQGSSAGKLQSSPYVKSEIPISKLNVQPKLHSPQVESPPSPDLDDFKIVLQPETRPISQEQLVAEVKGIYAGLVMVEGKCMQVDQKQMQLARDAPPGTSLKLSNEQWQALIALHRTLLHEHHDFFLASQHPSATPAIRKLANKYAMPARLWRHAIHSFLELLRTRLPHSLDHMLAFIYLAYSMMTLLYETVPAFKETWIECLGDLGRYRMAIEDDDIRDREIWTQVARQWYLKASDTQPDTGRLYHHLAILARPNALQQLFYYGKALSVAHPFIAARESVLTLFEPVLNQKQQKRFSLVVTVYVKLNAILFLHNNPENFAPSCQEFISQLDSHIARSTQKFLEHGIFIAISNTIALLSFGNTDSILMKRIVASSNTPTDITMGGTGEDSLMFRESLELFSQTIEVTFARVGDPNILSFVHVTMIFLYHVSTHPNAFPLLMDGFPLATLCALLNSLIKFYSTYDRIEGEERPVADKNDFRPCPEEFAIRGLFWADPYFPPDLFLNKNIEDENQYKEEPSMNTEYRPEMILWLAVKLARVSGVINYDVSSKNFSIPVQGEKTIMQVQTSMQINNESEKESTHSSPEKDLDTSSSSATVMGDEFEGMGFSQTSESLMSSPQNFGQGKDIF